MTKIKELMLKKLGKTFYSSRLFSPKIKLVFAID